MAFPLHFNHCVWWVTYGESMLAVSMIESRLTDDGWAVANGNWMLADDSAPFSSGVMSGGVGTLDSFCSLDDIWELRSSSGAMSGASGICCWLWVSLADDSDMDKGPHDDVDGGTEAITSPWSYIEGNSAVPAISWVGEFRPPSQPSSSNQLTSSKLFNMSKSSSPRAAHASTVTVTQQATDTICTFHQTTFPYPTHLQSSS